MFMAMICIIMGKLLDRLYDVSACPFLGRSTEKELSVCNICFHLKTVTLVHENVVDISIQFTALIKFVHDKIARTN
jgi:hypothetical protein